MAIVVDGERHLESKRRWTSVISCLCRSVALRRIGQPGQAMHELRMLSTDSDPISVPCAAFLQIMMLEIMDALETVTTPEFSNPQFHVHRDATFVSRMKGNNLNWYKLEILVATMCLKLSATNQHLRRGSMRQTVLNLVEIRQTLCVEISELHIHSCAYAHVAASCAVIDSLLGDTLLLAGNVRAAAHAFAAADKWLLRCLVLQSQRRAVLQDTGEVTIQCLLRYEILKQSCKHFSLLALSHNTTYAWKFASRSTPTITHSSLSVDVKEDFVLDSLRLLQLGMHIRMSSEAEIINNMAVNALYQCDLDYAIALLEGAIQAIPMDFLCDATTFNLSTLYDVYFDTSSASLRKRTLRQLATASQLYDIDKSSFRL
eukprot:CAMPEP_0185694390 /NCGR_PEP_ID=MMETSP1164-20130828/3874_1 /TAXON_ID=1104430 /ORGANISM="Chrysoreinhardia sp, Strain CCMP2950" /LENGTH=372 /DNA_ID=CAMNT_0028361225 /DNA_START=244 /DNA_END=1363 /DNA_ORIENTATION=-